MTVIFASLNVGLHRAEACGKHADKKFRAIARGMREAFNSVKVHALGLVGVGDDEDGLSEAQAVQFMEIIQQELPNTPLDVHASPLTSPYMLLSKADMKVDIRNVRVEQNFVSQSWRKALRATFVEADSEIDLWLVHLAISDRRQLSKAVSNQMLNHLESERPTVIAGDINTSECVIRHWMQNSGAPFAPFMATSGAPDVQHGDYTIATNLFLWQVNHQIGKSFEAPNTRAIDCVSDAHDMVCVIWSCMPQRRSKATSSSGNDDAAEGPTADADELGDAADCIADLHLHPDEAVRFKTDGVRAIGQAQQALLEAEEASIDFGGASSDEECEPPSTHDQTRARSRSRSRSSPTSRSKSCLRVNGQKLPQKFLADLKNMLWPVNFQVRDRPADLLSFESSLSAMAKMAPLEATASVAGLILALRQHALDRRVAEARRSRTFPMVPNADAPLTYEEVGWVLDFWRSKFREQALTKEQEAKDETDGLSRDKRRQKMRSRFTSYMSHALGSRTLGMALITVGFNVDLHTLANAYARATSAGADASSSADRDLRKKVLSMRTWYRWGRQLDNGLRSGEVEWESLGPTAQEAWEWYANGRSAEECDKLSREYGHGMLRTGRDRGTFLGQQATGSAADRICAELLESS